MSCIPPEKYVSASQTEHVQLIMPQHLNGYGQLFGGQLAAWIDVLAGIVARRHCGCAITTAAIDNLRFLGPARQNELIVLKGRITHVGTTSMEVRVDSYVEDECGGQKLVNTAFVVLVALGESGKPCRVPGLILRTDRERSDFAAGAMRRQMRQNFQKELYQ